MKNMHSLIESKLTKMKYKFLKGIQNKHPQDEKTPPRLLWYEMGKNPSPMDRIPLTSWARSTKFLILWKLKLRTQNNIVLYLAIFGAENCSFLTMHGKVTM